MSTLPSEMVQRGVQGQLNALVGNTSGQGGSISTADRQPSRASRKKRNLPGTPDPSAEVVALSPRTLMATNRFTCEICNKGFQRDQNLQLHRRGHNLPWKLRQRPAAEMRKRVYVCPETSCVHHNPARALGDLTGIKKHYFRKHGEKTWRCERCCKRYAVQSDWKAHMKVCGTKEYRCDCGGVFSRRDSFVTHRAFCDALTQESSKLLRATATSLVAPPPSFQPNHGMSVPFNPCIFPSSQLMPSHVALPYLQLGESSSAEGSTFMSATPLLHKATEMGMTAGFGMSAEQHLLYDHQQEMVAVDFMGLGGVNDSQRRIRQRLVGGGLHHHHPYQSL